MKNLFQTIIEEIETFEDDSLLQKDSHKEYELSNKIFIVHGHDEEAKQSVARFLEQIDLEPIILHEQPDKGKTIIEKFEEYSDVHCAIILLTPDDDIYNKEQDCSDPKYRARQNVIFELGFFIGTLGRKNIMTLYKKIDDFEFPSDYTGILYTHLDDQ